MRCSTLGLFIIGSLLASTQGFRMKKNQKQRSSEADDNSLMQAEADSSRFMTNSSKTKGKVGWNVNVASVCELKPQSTRWKWIGVAPFCAAKPSDCTDGGWTYVQSSTRGEGAACWSGHKVLCKAETMGMDDVCNPECNDKFAISVQGVAPFCAADECDCLMAYSWPVRSTSQQVQNPCSHRPNWGGETKVPCASGNHVICAKPKQSVLSGTLGADLAKAVSDARSMCMAREEMRHETVMQIMNLAEKVIAAVASAR